MAESNTSIDRFESVLTRFEQAVRQAEAALDKIVEKPRHLITEGARTYEALDDE